jgi:hypothetical protein
VSKNQQKMDPVSRCPGIPSASWPVQSGQHSFTLGFVFRKSRHVIAETGTNSRASAHANFECAPAEKGRALWEEI